MKKLITLFFVFLSMPAFAQINNMVKATKVSKINTKALDPGIPKPLTGIFPIISGQVSATPISIPSQNNQPLVLTHLMDRISKYSNYPYSTIDDCSLLSYKNKQLKIRLSYSIKTQSNHPVYAGAWFYDKYDNAVEVGYIPEMITLKPSGKIDVIMEFKKYPVTTEYLKVMLLQDGKEIAARSYKACFLWNGPVNSVARLANVEPAAKVNHINMAKVASAQPYVPDLEITGVKVVDIDDNILPYESGCYLRNKIIYITNTGAKESSPYILSVGYFKKKGNRGRYIEVKRFSMPSLLPGIETWRQVILPDEADNIKADLIIRNTNYNGETNLSNNSLELACTRIY